MSDKLAINQLKEQAMRTIRTMTIFVLALAVNAGYFRIASAASPTKDLPAQLVEQLELSRKALDAKGLPIRLVSYAAAASLDTEAAVRTAKAQIVDGSAVIPRYDGENASSFQLNTIQERTKAFQAGKEAENVVSNIQSMALTNLKVGQEALDVTWDSQGRKFQTKLIYDEKGIVYDNMLTNIAFIEAEPVTAETRASAPKASEGLSAKGSRNWSTRFRDYTIHWVWGGTRGKILMDHYVVTCDGWRSYCDDGGQVSAWMNLGHATGKTARNSLQKKNRISKLAWAFGWATPTASFHIKWSAKELTFSASVSGIGSSGKGAGIHTID
jgi:hypothetical protein